MEGTSDDDAGLSYLLDMDGWVSEVGGGFLIRARVHRTEASDSAPHGISYSLTLHEPGGQRVIGYDNAHSFVKKRGMKRITGLTRDHRHYRNLTEAYPFTSAARLLEDFWADVERFLQEEGVT
jgi:hypothetical protein